MEKDTLKHVNGEKLEAYAMNSLNEDEAAVVEEHLLFCETCQDELESVERYVLAMKAAAARTTKEEAAEASVPGVWDRLRAWLHTPMPVWSGAVALATIILAVGLHVGQQPPGPPVDVRLEALRGDATQVVQAGHALNLKLDGRGLPEQRDWQIEIVSSQGNRVWLGTGTWSPEVIAASVPKSFKPGTFFVRLFRDGEEPAREFKMVVQ
jgi:anti-sigma factor RsiW